MKAQSKTSARLWAILAREAPVAVIFRRGPSKQVRLIKWNLRTDAFECGQWFKGRIYERRCDLSPDGKLLVYFASKQSLRENPTWTAISKPPYLTALALWYNGTCWNGGGVFLANDSVMIDPGMFACTPVSGLNLGKIQVTIGGLPYGEDAPVWETTLKRDGWKFNPPKTWRKSNPKKSFELEMAIYGIAGKRRGWYHIGYRVLSGDSCVLPEMDADWADWDRKGDLLYARNGIIYRQRLRHGGFLPPIVLIDLNGQKFENIAPSPAALRW